MLDNNTVGIYDTVLVKTNSNLGNATAILHKGDQLRAYYFLKYLSKRYHIYMYALSDVEVGE